MAVKNKVKNTAQAAKGKVKERTGKATGDRSMQARGKAERASGKLKEAGENVKDALRS
jgi:uncharacterized protein YjbJ (UPF0337 family)